MRYRLSYHLITGETLTEYMPTLKNVSLEDVYQLVSEAYGQPTITIRLSGKGAYIVPTGNVAHIQVELVEDVLRDV